MREAEDGGSRPGRTGLSHILTETGPVQTSFICLRDGQAEELPVQNPHMTTTGLHNRANRNAPLQPAELQAVCNENK